MSQPALLHNELKVHRRARGWSQQVLAARSGISRAGVSAIEMGRLVPSTAAALALAGALECRVEELFRLACSGGEPAVDWAWKPVSVPGRYWTARVGGRVLRYPVEAGATSGAAHDGVFDGRTFREAPSPPAAETLVIASCDPAADLLAAELQRRHGVRLIVLPRSSRQALRLLQQGVVHLAGVHLTASNNDGNAAIVRQELGAGYVLLRGADWTEGVAIVPGAGIRSVAAAVRADLRWIGREPGSGARQCLDQVLSRRRTPRRVARDHRGVAEAIRSGWADAGVCLRLASDEAGLDFLSIRREEYDLCYAEDLERDPRLQSLIQTLRSPSFRGLLADLPGYDAAHTGQIQRVG